MSLQNKISGVVLAGGQGRRMQQQDKGLVLFKNQAMIQYTLQAMAPLVDDLLISANRNRQLYSQLGYPVISDSRPNFDGPLAGILTAMQHARHTLLMVCPCDSPLIGTAQLQRLLTGLTDTHNVALAHDGKRLHPVFMVIRTHLQSQLQTYLHSGERRLETWLLQQAPVTVDFSDCPEVFGNINTEEELRRLSKL